MKLIPRVVLTVIVRLDVRNPVESRMVAIRPGIDTDDRSTTSVEFVDIFSVSNNTNEVFVETTSVPITSGIYSLLLYQSESIYRNNVGL